MIASAEERAFGKRHRTPVAIVGGGPVGLMMALFLERHGVASTVFNTEATTRPHPKGSTHNARTMEHYRRLGLADRIRKLGLPFEHPMDVAYFTRFNGWELARLPMPSTAALLEGRAAAPPTGQLVEPLHRANQMYVERVLLERARTSRLITLRFGWHVESFKQDEQGVDLQAQRTGASAERWRARFLVGCDGGRSGVRKALGIDYAGQETLKQVFFGGRMLSSHLRIPSLYPDHLGGRRAFQYWTINPDDRIALVALNGVDEFLVWTPCDAGELPPDEIVRRVQRCVGAPLEVEVLASHGWNAGVALHAERFGLGRVQLAGDAVHLFTPTGGFGLNTGIDDAANLSWKLVALVQGWGGPRLLDSYEAERKPIAIRNTSAARALARSVGEVVVTPDIERDSPEGRAERRRIGDFLQTFGDEFASVGVQLGARYDGSPLIHPDGDPPADDMRTYHPSGVPGGRAPHLWLDRGRGAGSSLYDRLGTGFTLLQIGDRALDPSPFVTAAARRNLPLTVLMVPVPEAMSLYGARLALIRPDQHVAWRGDAVPTDVDRVLARAVGH